MKKFILLMAWVAMAGGAGAAEWKLVWSDEFDSQGLPDKAKWGYEVGFLRNQESQYYTKDRSENARVENGMLVLECRKEKYKPDNHGPVEYTSASLTTLGKASWQYGRVEMRAKLPQGKGVWPAFWTLGTNITRVSWPKCGEIDIMEFVGFDTNHIHGTLHYSQSGQHQKNESQLEVAGPYDDFHLYAVEWHSDRIDFFLDGNKYHSVSLDKLGADAAESFRKPHYLLLNFALGGNWGGVIDDANLPQKYLIDYVRVYKQSPDKVASLD